MALKIDFLSDENDDLLINPATGDFVIDNATATQAGVILEADIGEFWNAPDLGVGIRKYIGSKVNKDELFNLIKEELEDDDIDLISLEVIENDINDIDYKIEVE